MSVIPVILAGGSGSRLWPLSRTQFPKQFLNISGDKSLFQDACSRLSGVLPPIIVTNEEHRFLALQQLRDINLEQADILLEPSGRNTAPAMTLAALEVAEEQILVVMPADQIIKDNNAFQLAINRSIELAEDGALVVLGVKPTHAHTGYGYIKSKAEDLECVESFVEKPDLQTAQKYLEHTNYHWNAGIFVVKAKVWLEALSLFRPDILVATQQAHLSLSKDGSFSRPCKVLFEKIPSESIDYSVIERCPSSEIPIKVTKLDAGWNDLGSWKSIASISEENEDCNSLSGDVYVSKTKNSYIKSTSRFVSVIGMNGIIAVETPDAILIANKHDTESVKKVVEFLNNLNREEARVHRRVNRPWGWYDTLEECTGFKVKRIRIAPGKSFSLQKHRYRAEHWIVVKGTAEVTRRNETITLTENQSTYIPLNEEHKLKNPCKTPLEIIEVQSGTYFGEDDIVRIED